MNHPEIEAKICTCLLEAGIPACRFIKNKQGKILSTDENGRRFTVQEYYEGMTYSYHEAPVKLQKESATMLAQIHENMKDIENVPVGIGADFFKYRKPEYMHEIYSKTLQRAVENGDTVIAEKIRSNIRIIETMPEYEFDIDRFSYGNTHGDYNTSQLIWKDEKIVGVIDFTCACKHPYIWEIVRSYVFMAPEVREGLIDIAALIRYISYYLECGSLKPYDIEHAGKLFYYFIAVCDFYGQYYDSLAKNRIIYLEQANMASGLILWFEKHIEELNDKLLELSKQMVYKKKLLAYYDSEGKLIQYPSKKPMRLIALSKIVDCFQYGKKYTEKEVNEIIRQNISFSDIELIRREMFQLKLMGRLKDGSEYWREQQI